jgi:hypothetical protein
MSRANDYRHIDKDPVLDLLRTVAQEIDPELKNSFLEKLSHESGISASTLYSWWKGDTKRPQHLTVKFVALALNCRLKLVRDDGREVRGKRNEED